MRGPCPSIQEGMVIDADCADCGHKVGDHAWPSGICMVCTLIAEGPEPDPLAEAVRHLADAVTHLADIIGRDRVF